MEHLYRVNSGESEALGSTESINSSCRNSQSTSFICGLLQFSRGSLHQQGCSWYVLLLPLGGYRQEPNAGEEVAQESVLLHAHETSRWGRAQSASTETGDTDGPFEKTTSQLSVNKLVSKLDM